MAKQISNLVDAQKALDDLRERKRTIKQRIAELEKKLQELDTEDTGKALEQITTNQQALDALRVLLSRMDPEIREAERRLEAAQRADLDRLTADLRQKEFEAFTDCIPALQALKQKAERLNAIHRELLGEGAHPRVGMRGGVLREVTATLETIADHHPELLGLPPNPTPEQLREREHKVAIARQETLLANLERQYEAWPYSMDIKNQIKRVREILQSLNPSGKYLEGRN